MMKVLLVDDEPRVVRALDRVLRTAAPRDWVVTTATSGREALEHLDREAADVVISDMSMPEIDGTALLSEVRDRWPGTVRVVLSGYSDPAAAARVATIAHQFFEKPAPVKELISALREIETGRARVPSGLGDMLNAIGVLPAPPSTFLSLTAAIADDRTHIDKLVAIVRRDPELVAKVLQIAGSTFFTRGQPTSDLRTAIGRIGVRLVTALALAASAFEVAPESGLTQEALTTHAISAATEAAQRVGVPRLAEDAFIAALLADVGLTALACWTPDRVRAARARAVRDGVPLHVAEQALFGFDHADVGTHLLRLWRLPADIVAAVAAHHTSDRASLADDPVKLAVYDAHTRLDEILG